MTKCGNLSIGKSILIIISAAGFKKNTYTAVTSGRRRQAKFWVSTVRTEFQVTFQEKKKTAKGKKRNGNTPWTNVDSRDLNKLGPKPRLASNQMFSKRGLC